MKSLISFACEAAASGGWMCYCFKAHLRCLSRLLWRSEDASLLFTVRSTTSLKRRSLFFTSSPNSPRSLELPLWQISGQPYPAVILGTQIPNNRSGLLYPAGGAYENYENYESYESCCWCADGNNHPCGTSSPRAKPHCGKANPRGIS